MLIWFHATLVTLTQAERMVHYCYYYYCHWQLCSTVLTTVSRTLKLLERQFDTFRHTYHDQPSMSENTM